MNGSVMSELLAVIKKKAEGYVSEERVEEYTNADGDLQLQKCKVTQKEVPPDLSAVKLLMEINGADPYENMTEEELEKEKKKLINQLKEKRKNETNRHTVQD